MTGDLLLDATARARRILVRLTTNSSVFVPIGAHLFQTHTRLEWSWGFIGRWIVVSPLNHRLHHSSDPRHFNRNFSTDLTFRDGLFGGAR